ncbi:MAG TPA: S-layer homology domain-containing protein [Acidimicrobiia bacterium]|nr:S-layer homology domain-containing protein [Acidimicrobiia bacterium]
MARITRSRAIALAILSLLVGLFPAPVSAQEGEPAFVIDGSGWGHGVGLSQYGARALAESGSTVDDIIHNYYAGVSIQQMNDVLGPAHWMNADPDPLWIGLAQTQTSLTFESVGGVARLCKANDGEGECPTQFASPGEAWEFRALGGGQCQFFQNGNPVGNPGTCRGSIEWDQPGTVIKLNGLNREMAWGRLRMRPIGSSFHISLEVGVEQYVRGIAEIPPSWHPAALQAQAIAARTYGVRQALRWGDAGENGDNLTNDRKIACWCQLYSTVVDQNYVGYYAEDGAQDVPWVQAIQATAGRIITHPQAPQQTVIIAYYSSSHGGHSDTNVEGLGAAPPAAAYLPAKPDPHSVAPAANNPYASWQVTLTASNIAARYGLDTVTGVAITKQNPSGSAAEVTITGTLGGAETTLVRTGRSFRSTMGLRSIFFTVDGAGAVAGSCRGSIPPSGFTDVAASSVHAADIDCVANEGVTSGVGDGRYNPQGTVTRWQMALFLTRTAPLLGVPVPSAQPPFTDLDGLSADTVAAIGSLAAMGVTSGTAATEFSPNQPVTRWQMALFLMRLHGLTGFAVPSGESQGFTDLAGHGESTVLAINQLAQLTITSGTSPGTYSPGLDVSREQMASFLARLIRLDGVVD